MTVFEALHEIGGVLVYGIPEFRLPKDIVRREVGNLEKMGVRFETNVVVGRTVTIDELMQEEGYDAVFVATGAGLPKFLGVPGENLNGVYSANEFLSRVNLMKAYRFPEYDEPIYDCRGKQVAVIGGGNTALDAIRTALRLGASKAMMLYRRTEAEMPGRAEEVHHAKDEGVEIHTLTQPVEFLGDDKGWLRAARCIRMALGEPDDSGRRRPVPVEGSEFEIPLDVAIVAVGTGPNPLVQSTTPDLGDEQEGLHRGGRPGDAAHLEEGRLRRGRHRHRRRHRHPGDGRRPQGRPLDRRVPEDRRLVACQRAGARAGATAAFASSPRSGALRGSPDGRTR